MQPPIKSNKMCIVFDPGGCTFSLNSITWLTDEAQTFLALWICTVHNFGINFLIFVWLIIIFLLMLTSLSTIIQSSPNYFCLPGLTQYEAAIACLAQGLSTPTKLLIYSLYDYMYIKRCHDSVPFALEHNHILKVTAHTWAIFFPKNRIFSYFDIL